MHRLQLLSGIVGILLLGQPVARAGELPKQIASAACRTAPEVDGVIGDEEWKDAPPVEFSWKMVRRDKPTTTRACQLRVMNSANGLYVALRVPDSTVNSSLSPFNVDWRWWPSHERRNFATEMIASWWCPACSSTSTLRNRVRTRTTSNRMVVGS